MLVVGQVAMTVVLLAGAGLLVRTVLALNRANAGFDKHGVLTMDVGLPAARYTPERRVVFFRDAVAALRALPGVESAAAANSLAVIGSPRGSTTFHRLGTPELTPNDQQAAVIRVVTPGYFHTLRIPVLRGREFTEADAANPAAGFIVNEAFVKAFLSDVDPLTTAISVWMEDENPHLPIIGIVGNVSEGSVRDEPQPTVFYSHRRLAETAMTLFVRTNQPDALTKTAVGAIHAIDRNLAVTNVRSFETAMADSLARERLSALVSGSFAVSGLLLASLGLYGLLAFLVTERTREIGIRIALGAQRGTVTGSVIGSGLRLVVIGAASGVALSLVVLRLFRTLLFGVTPYDAATYVVVLALLGVVAALASYLPARRAARVEPLVALRQE
jgi:predicted permease